VAHSKVANEENGHRTCMVAANILNKQSMSADKRWSYNFIVDRRTNNLLP